MKTINKEAKFIEATEEDQDSAWGLIINTSDKNLCDRQSDECVGNEYITDDAWGITHWCEKHFKENVVAGIFKEVKVKSTKQLQAEEVAKLIKEASLLIQTANGKMEEYGLNLENYPENWTDFAEHPDELQNIFVSEFDRDSTVQVMVGEV